MIHICFNLDTKYILPCKVLIRNIDSLASEPITYHFIGIDKLNMGTDNQCKFYPNPDVSCFQDEHLKDYYYFSKAAMYRLLIPFLIDSDRAIYIDIDTILLKDIKTLWGKEVDYVGAVVDPCSIFHKNRLKLKADNYFNSGVILFNSKKIRENIPDYKERILQAQKDYILDLKDQDLFNIVFNKHITDLGYEFNMDVHNLKEKDETKDVSLLKDTAFKDPTIVHCMGEDKWWNFQGLKFGELWDSYAKELTPKNRKRIQEWNGMLIIRN